MSSNALKVADPVSPPVAEHPSIDGMSIMSLVHRLASDPSVSVERVNQAFDFYQRVEAERSGKAWASAFVAAQSEMEPVRKDATNKQTNSKYATFDALDRAIRPIYSKHGFAPTYNVEPSEKPEHVRVVLFLIHSSGHERRYEIDMPADGKGANGGDVMTKTHAAGSAFSYGKRYLLGGAFNVITTDRDDDGNAAGGNAMRTIAPNQIAELEALIEGTGSDKAKFLAIGNLESIEEMPAKDFAGAKAMLVKKLGGMKK